MMCPLSSGGTLIRFLGNTADRDYLVGNNFIATFCWPLLVFLIVMKKQVAKMSEREKNNIGTAADTL